MDNLNSPEIELYNGFTKNRENLVDIIDRINDHNTLKETLLKIEEKHPNNKHILHDLFLGEYGGDENKFSAIYEIPTKELIDSIFTIFKMYNITNINEVGAGMGLLTALLQKKCDMYNYKVELQASDSCRSDLTNISLDYTKIIKKDISDVIMQYEKNLNPPDGIICSHPLSFTMIEQLYDLIKSNYAKIIILITDVFETEKRLMLGLSYCNYNVYYLPIYQCSCSDKYKNSNIKNLFSRSYTTVLVRKDLKKIDLPKILEPNLYEIKTIHPLETNLLFLATLGKIPRWLSELENKNDLRIVINIIQEIFIYGSRGNKKIPDWIPNIELLSVWYHLIWGDMLPVKINTGEKLQEYYDLIHTPLDKLVKDNIIPQWLVDLNSKPYINLYFWLMYTISEDNNDNEWKKNRYNFAVKINSYRR